MNNQSYQSELDTYFKTINHAEVAERILYKGSLSKARAKLRHEAFIELYDQMLRGFYAHFPFQTWHGFNLLSVDGPTLRVQMKEQLPSYLVFGIQAKARSLALRRGRRRCMMS